MAGLTFPGESNIWAGKFGLPNKLFGECGLSVSVAKASIFFTGTLFRFMIYGLIISPGLGGVN